MIRVHKTQQVLPQSMQCIYSKEVWEWRRKGVYHDDLTRTVSPNSYPFMISHKFLCPTSVEIVYLLSSRVPFRLCQILRCSVPNIPIWFPHRILGHECPKRESAPNVLFLLQILNDKSSIPRTDRGSPRLIDTAICIAFHRKYMKPSFIASSP